MAPPSDQPAAAPPACAGAHPGQAFPYNSVTFGYAVILTTYLKTPTSATGYYFVVIAIGNFLGLLLFGTAALFQRGVLTAATMTASSGFASRGLGTRGVRPTGG